MFSGLFGCFFLVHDRVHNLDRKGEIKKYHFSSESSVSFPRFSHTAPAASSLAETVAFFPSPAGATIRRLIKGHTDTVVDDSGATAASPPPLMISVPPFEAL